MEDWRLVGTENEGFRHILHGLNPERILLASEACGIGEVALDRATTYAKERIVFDRPIGANQAISHPLAQARIQLKAAWMMALHAGRRYDAGLECGEAANSAKYLAAEASFFAADRGGADPRWHGVRERVPRGALLAGSATPAHRAGHAGDDAQLHRAADHGSPEELLIAMASVQLSSEVPHGDKGRPFASATFDLAEQGYVEEEWFLAGDASTYGPAPRRDLGADGHWAVVATGTEGFRTRLLVRRPIDSARFDGTVVLEWFNVSGGIDIDPVWAQSSAEIMRAGNAWVGVSAQRAGVNAPPLMPGFSQPLELWDRARYGSLAIANDDLSYGIFTAAARQVRTGSLTAGRPVDVIIAAGSSQSANRLVTYVNGVQPIEGAIDAFLVHGRVGTSSPPLASDVPSPDPLTFRTDLSAPVLVLESEFDTLRSWAARQPDSEHFRLWEVAGSTHQDEFVERTLNVQFARDLGVAAARM